MKKKTIIIMALAGLLLWPAIGQAQGRFSVTPHVGINLSNIGGQGHYDVFSTRVGFTGGVDAEYRFIPQFGVSLGVAYSKQGCNTNEVHRLEGPTMDINSRIKSRQLHYLVAPLLLNLHLGKGFTLKAGAQVGYLMWARNSKLTYGYWGRFPESYIYGPVRVTNSYYYSDGRMAPEPSRESLDKNVENVEELRQKSSEDAIDSYHRFYCAIPLGLSYEYKRVVVDARYYYNLVKIVRAQPDNVMDNQCLSLTVGYRLGGK